jgi:hypothetical protein
LEAAAAAPAVEYDTTCLSVRLRTEVEGTVDPRKGEQRSLREVPLMNVASKTTSSKRLRAVLVLPTMVPEEPIGTRPESWT